MPYCILPGAVLLHNLNTTLVLFTPLAALFAYGIRLIRPLSCNLYIVTYLDLHTLNPFINPNPTKLNRTHPNPPKPNSTELTPFQPNLTEPNSTQTNSTEPIPFQPNLT